MKLDLKDWKILYELDKNSRLPDTEIAKRVELSRETVAYRIKKLMVEGIIKNFMTILNTPSLGFITFRVHFKFNSLTKKREKEIQEALLRGAFWLVRVRGQWDFNAMFQTKDYYKFKHFMDNFKLRFGNYLENYKIDIITKIHHFRRSYLLMHAQPEKENVEIWGELDKNIGLDDLDFKILETIDNNARMNSLEIAKRCNTTERIVRYRLKNLIDNKVIIGFRAALDINKLGYIYVKVQLKLNNMSKAEYDNLYRHLKLHKYVVYITESIGGPDYEFEFQIRNTKQLYELIEELRDKFDKNIVDWDWMEYIEESKLSYLYET